MMTTKRQIFFWIVAVIGFFWMIWAAQDVYHLLEGKKLAASFCNLTTYWNCDRAALSSFGSFQGIPLSVFGAAWFWAAFFLGLSFFKKRLLFLRPWLLLGALVSVSLALYLHWGLHTGCLICYGSYFLIFILLGLGWNLSAGPLALRQTLFCVGGGFLGLFIWIFVKTSNLNSIISEEEFQRWVASLPVNSVPEVSTFQKGLKSSRIEVIEFSDFGCPFCEKAASILIPFLETQKDVQIIFYPFPLDSACNSSVKRSLHPYSCEWAKAMICAGKPNRHWEVHDEAFRWTRREEKLPPPTLENDCLKSQETDAQLQRLIQVGQELKIKSTPTWFINGRRIEGFIQLPLLKRLLEEERK